MFDTTIDLEPCEEGGFTATLPAFPNCISEGDTKEEALRNITEAIILHLYGINQELKETLNNIKSVSEKLSKLANILLNTQHYEDYVFGSQLKPIADELNNLVSGV